MIDIAQGGYERVTGLKYKDWTIGVAGAPAPEHQVQLFKY
jgi:hypothetical protein